MNRKFFAFILLFAAGLSLSSCLNSNDNNTTEYTHDTAITAFSIGTVKRYYQAKSSSTNNDTTLSADVTGSKYKFYIDQTTHQIYNPDSLPMGTKLSSVLTTITAKESSPIVWMKINVDSIQASYSSTDSVDLSSTRKLRVYNNDGSAYVTYTVNVNAHQEKADSFQWHSLSSNNAKIAALQDLKAVSMGANIYVLGTDGNELKIYKSGISDGRSWSEVVPTETFSQNAYKNVAVLEDALYLLDAGKVYRSIDATSWYEIGEATTRAEVGAGAPLTQLIGASSKYLYAYNGTGISVSRNQGVSWTPETLDAVADSLPTHSISLNVAKIASIENTENLLLMGIHEKTATHGDTIAVSWIRTLDYDDENVSGWNYINYDNNQLEKLPYASQVMVAESDSGYVALTSGGEWYNSKNGGLLWKADTTVVMPNTFDGTSPFTLVRDENKFYWLINAKTGNVWKGRYNKDGWRKEQTSFE